MFGLFNTPAWQLVLQSDFMTKCVLLALFALSVICGWIVIAKLVAVHKQKRSMSQLIEKINSIYSFDDLLAVGKRHHDTVGGAFLTKGLHELNQMISRDGKELSGESIEHLQLLFDQYIEQLLVQEESYLPVLATSAAVSPLVGLFGTVWGLVHAFISISQEKSADIAVVAPGIAEALLTTLAGLMVAIPALVFFQYLSNEIRKIERHLISLSDRMVAIIRKTFVQ